MSVPDELIAGRYRLVNRVGRGGMGVVWEAWDERLHRRVAVKQLHAQPGLSDADAELANLRAMREARITARLDHPHAVPVFDVVEHDGQPCLIMQFLPSTPLSEVLREERTLSMQESARIGAQIASALAAAHRAGIVHRDVKPGNVLIAADGTARISDFGISHALGDSTLTATGMVHGTPAYLAPEVARGGDSTFASDVFGLGATLYTVREGEPPFGKDQNSIALLYRVASGNFTPPTQSGILTPLLLRMLSSEPADRPDMGEVARSLTTLAADSGAEPDTLRFAEADVATVRTETPRSPRPWGPPAAAAAGVAAMGGDSEVTPSAANPVAAAPPASVSSPPPTGAGGTARPTAAPPPAPVERRRRPLLWMTVAVAALLGIAVLAYGLTTGPGGIGAVPGATPEASEASRSAEPSSSPSAPTPSASPTASSSPSASPSASASESDSAPPKPPATPTRSPSASSSPSSPAGDDNNDDEGNGNQGNGNQGNDDQGNDDEGNDDQGEGNDNEVEGTPTASELATAISSYYALMPGNRDAGWSRLTSSYQRGTASGRSSYDRFWRGIERVSVSGVRGTPPDRAQATVTYRYSSGRVVRERTSFRLVAQGGALKINSSSVVSRQ